MNPDSDFRGEVAIERAASLLSWSSLSGTFTHGKFSISFKISFGSFEWVSGTIDGAMIMLKLASQGVLFAALSAAASAAGGGGLPLSLSC
eukprot:scaffold3526_cov153-Amphora_coffeaeformis.AAC.15